MIEKLDQIKKYKQLSEKIKNDRNAQRLLTDLIEMGEQIQSALDKHDDSYKRKAEFDLLQKQFEENSDVKEFLSAQKNYMNVMTMVRSAISDSIENAQG